MGHQIVDFQAMMIGNVPGVEIRDDKVSISLSFEDGSFGTIHYLANGGSAFPKERIEVFCDNAVLQMDNYRILKGYGWAGKETPIPYNEVMESSKVTIEVANLLKS